MVFIDKTQQLNVFTTIQNIILNNSTLNVKFTKNNILDFEPTKINSPLPQLIFKIPNISNDDKTLGTNPTYNKDFDIEIIMRVQWLAKDKVITYLNALINAFESDSTLQAVGYYLDEITFDTPDIEDYFGDNVVLTIGTLSLKGDVSYG